MASHRKPTGPARDDTPRTDLPPTKLPYDDDYFGTGEEEGVVAEREAADSAEPGDERPARRPGPGRGDR